MPLIRRADLNDLEFVVPLFNDYRQFYGQPDDTEGSKKFLGDRLRVKDSVIFLCTENDEAIGFTQLYPIFSSVRMKPALLLNDLYVHARSRKKGVGAALLKSAVKYGKETGSKWLMLSTAHDNINAQSVYEKNGWERITDVFYEYAL